METSKLESLQNIIQSHPVRHPKLPGDVLVSGDLPQEVVEQLAADCKGWLYLNPETDKNFMPDLIKSKGSEVKVVPFKPAKDPGFR